MGLRLYTVALLAVCAASPGAAGTFTETFSTATYKNVANTSADWDTLDGELRLRPFAASIVGSYDTPGTASDVVVAGDLAFIADGASGLQIVDVTDPTSPVLVGTYATIAAHVAVAGDLAFVTNTSLHILDITDPTAPVLVGTFASPGVARDVAVAGDFVYLADGSAGLQIVNIVDPTMPTLAGTYDTPGFARDVVVAGDLAFVADGDERPRILDVSNPANPTLVAAFASQGDVIALAGNLLFIDWSVIYDVSNPASPVFVGLYQAPEFARDIAVEGNLLLMACGPTGLQVADITDPTAPFLASSYDTPGSALGVAVAGDLAFVADDSTGLQIIRIADSVSPLLTGSYDTSGVARDLVIDGDHAFVADDTAGLRILDITDPTSPALVGTANTPGQALDVHVAGDLALVADGASGLQLLDIEDPTNPTLLAGIPTLGVVDAVVASGDFAYVVNDLPGLVIVSISNPASPTVAGAYPVADANAIVVALDLAFVAVGFGGLQIFDISVPAMPVLLGTYDTTGNALDVALSGDLAFIADGNAGLRIVDVTNPATPVLLSTYNTPGTAQDVAVSGNLAFVADGSGGLVVLDISDPSNPVLVGTYDSPGTASGVAAAGELVFVADGTSGMHAVQVLQRAFDLTQNSGRSVSVNGLDTDVYRARLSSTQFGNVSWELSANGGATFQAFAPGPNWTLFNAPGDDVVWRSTHTWSGASLNPTVDDVTIEWLNEYPVIASIADIPNDQGRQVRVTWTRSGRDFAGDTVLEYSVYRRIDPGLSKTAARVPESSPVAVVDRDDLSPIAREHARRMLASGWDYLVTVPALRQESYAVVAATLADSTITNGEYMTAFRVTAMTGTPGVFFDSPPDSGSSIDNLPPGTPQGFAATPDQGDVDLVWDPAPEPDFRYYRVYRSTTPGFVPGPATLVHQTAGTSWQDTPNPGAVFYKLTAVDFSGNESDPASADVVPSAVDDSTLPVAFALRGATPNPARSRTHIAFDLPAQVAVSLQVYDVTGRIVRTLARGPMPAGAHVARWDGRDSNGRRVPAGVYLYRLRAGSFESTGRLTLVR